MTSPPASVTERASAVTVCVTTEVASALPSCSYSEVLPRRSAKRTVRSEMRVIAERKFSRTT